MVSLSGPSGNFLGKFGRLLLIKAIFMFLLFPAWSLADTEPAARVAVSSGDSSAGGESNTALPDQFTGAMTYQIPIQVPAGRNGLSPDIAVRYQSNNRNGWLGVGWDLELGSIQRSVKNGVNYSGDSYQIKTSGSVFDLSNVGNNEYLALIESKFSRIRKLTAPDNRVYWELTDKTGTRFLFGQSTASRQDDPNDTSRIFKWCLDRIEDPNGNYIAITYSKDQGEIYPDRIDYNGNQIKLYFDKDQNLTDQPAMYTTNFLVKTAKRLKLIDVLAADGSRIGAHKLTYDISAVSKRSLMTSFESFDKNATVDTSGTITSSTPSQTQSFTYSSPDNTFNSPAWQNHPWGLADVGNQFIGDFNGDGKTDYMYNRDSTWYVVFTLYGTYSWLNNNSGPSGPPNNPAYQFTGDFNGDGKTDYMYNYNGNWYVALSNGEYSVAPTLWLGSSGPDGTITRNAGYQFIADFNGDGKTDFMYNDNGNWYVALSNGQKFDAPTFWLGSSGPDGTTTRNAGYQFIADFNGDGKTDYMYNDNGNWYVALSNGQKFDAPTFWLGSSGPDGTITRNSVYHFIADFNGDGKMDYMYNYNGNWYVALSNGHGFDAPTFWLGSSGPDGTTTRNSVYQFIADFNGDSKMDYMYNYNGNWYVALSNGHGFDPPTLWLGSKGPDGPTRNAGYQFIGDFNGDGKPDYWYYYDGAWYLAQSKPMGDLLETIKNNVGGTTTISYSPSTTYTNPQLPFPVQTVSSVSTDDGNDNVSTTSYTYSGGFFHIGERDFRGFNYAKETGPVGPNGEQKITETWFHQGNDTAVDKNFPDKPTGYMKGKPYRTRITDGSGKKYSETTISYAPDTNGAPYFNPPYQVDSYTYDGNDSYTQTRTVYTYDGYGNVAREDQYGNVNDPTDNRTIVRTYSPNTSSWITGLPASENIYQGIGTTNKIAGRDYYYDDLSACNGTPTNNQTPVRGKLTRIESYLNGGTNPEVRMAYDTFGNPVCQRDAKGNTSTVVYDASHTFPTIITNPLGQQTVTKYYGVDGVPADKGLYGQVKSVTDPNTAAILTEYDAFGRKTKETLPDGTWTSLSYNNFGMVGSQHVRADNSAGLWKTSYFDGLGRTFKEKASGLDQKNITTDTTYNLTGTVKQTSFPYFAGSETPRIVTYDYDPLGRPLRTANPDSTKNLFCYDDGITVKIDANGHKLREVRDAHDKLVKIQEYTGNYGTCTTEEGTPYATTLYNYDVLGNLRFVTDAKTNNTEMRYDTLSRKIYMNDPDMGVWSYGYDANNNLTSQTDAKKQTITFGYDSLNRLINKNYPNGSSTVLTYDESTSSNAKGRLTKMTDGSGKAVYNYDKVGRITSAARTIDSVTHTLSFNYLDGRLNSITYPDNDSVTYGYDAAGNLKSAGSYATLWNYDALGRPQGITYGNGTIAVYAFDSTTKRLSTSSLTSPKGLLINNSYGYDNAGNITTITNSLDSNRSQSFVYDELNRLKQSISNSYGTLGYSYDQIGNILTKEGITYSYGTRPHAVASLSNGRTFTYDANGNIINDGRHAITYDFDNMPTVVNSVNFSYDGNGKRIKKIANGYTTTYIDKYYQCINGACSKFIYAGDKRIALKNSSQTLYYHTDHQGSTSIVTNASGSKVEDIAYYPFGGTRQDTSPSGTLVSHKYTGQENDAETGLYNYDARLYDPETGRFLTPDTIVPDPANPQSLNRYSYVINNPMNFTDPTGHGFFSDLWKALGDLFRQTDRDKTSYDSSYNSNDDSSYSNITFRIEREASYSYPADPWARNYAYQNYEQQSNTGPPERSSSGGSTVGGSQDVKNNTGDKILGNKPGDIFTVGASIGYVFGFGISFDRIIMPNGKPDWYFTLGGGLIAPGAGISIDRGKIFKYDSIGGKQSKYDFSKSDVKGFSISGTLDPVVVGGEMAVAPFVFGSVSGLAYPTPLITLKGGPRVSFPSASLFGNWTWDIGR